MTSSAATILKFVGPAHVAGGLLLFLTGFVPPAQEAMARFFAASTNLAWSPFFVAVLGPTIASWGLLFTVLVLLYLEAPSRRLWNALLWSIVIWAPLDTALCLYFEVYGGAIINAAIVVIIIGLLFGVRDAAPGSHQGKGETS